MLNIDAHAPTQHFTYRLFAADDTLLYVGCTKAFGHRFHEHVGKTPWFGDVVRITLERHPTWYDARIAEATAIRTENPRHNRVRTAPEDVCATLDPRKPRGDGVHCPKCGNLKRKRSEAYCVSCMGVDRRERKIKAGWVPPELRPPKPPPICPRCKVTPRHPKKDYCLPCQRELNREYRKNWLAKRRAR